MTTFPGTNIHISPAPWETEIYRHFPMFSSFYFEAVPPIAVDNSGAAVPSILFRPTFSLTTGGVLANKTKEYGYSHVTQLGTRDMFARPEDATSHGRWRRFHSLECLVCPSSSATPSATMYAGIGMGSYLAVPPDPATTLDNVIRLVVQMNTLTWQLIVHPGNGVAAQSKTALVGVTAPVLGRVQHARIVYNPNAYVRAYVDGVLGAELTSGLPVVPPTTANNAYAMMLVTSGSLAGNCIAGFMGLRAFAMGLK